jgi:hypothetical protein
VASETDRFYAAYKEAGVRELVIHFSDATHLDAIRPFAQTFVGMNTISSLNQPDDQKKYSSNSTV